ncbi:HAD-IIIA family hydrolase [Actinoplanes sp. NPDC051343]|uniref:HAD-IIIA family hydrolase n=1 Tax=Actinoplanes sp. NPDC051343 TaxID=3363906 RepID=UPI0037BD489F
MSRLFEAVLFDRDGTLIVDVPYNGDPARVEPMPGARAALDRVRAAGLKVGVVTNQSGLARGLFTAEQLAAVNRKVEELLGPFDTWQICPHDGDAGCRCRKPAPGLVEAAAEELGVEAYRCVVVGDIGRDMTAALAAGAAGVLVPTPVTLPDEVAAASEVAGDLTAAVDRILRRQALAEPAPRPGKAGTVLVVRSDSAGDVLVTGPAIRAVAHGSDRVVMLCGPRGRAAAELLPGVDELIEWRLPWIDPSPEPVDPSRTEAMVRRIRETGADEAVVFTSFHQSALPLALVLRLAGIGRITAISEDYPGALLDVRHRVPEDLPEPERARSVAAAAGFDLPPGDDGALRINREAGRTGGNYVVVHPGASVEARACPPDLMRRIVTALSEAGHRVVVTGGPDERLLAKSVGDDAGPMGLAELAQLIAGAKCLVVGNTGPAHLAAAVGTPVVSLFAPTVPYGKWGPYRVPAVRLGRAGAACRDSRAVVCPVPGHPCLSTIEPAEVVEAVARLTRSQLSEVAA